MSKQRENQHIQITFSEGEDENMIWMTGPRNLQLPGWLRGHIGIGDGGSGSEAPNYDEPAFAAIGDGDYIVCGQWEMEPEVLTGFAFAERQRIKDEAVIKGGQK